MNIDMNIHYERMGYDVIDMDLITTLESCNRALELNLGSSQRHSLMYKKASLNPSKGQMDGDCNVTQCQEPNAIMYNNGTHAWYCEKCASDINYSCRHSEFYPLCISKDVKLQDDLLQEIKEAHRKEVQKRNQPLVPRVYSSPNRVDGKKVIGRNSPCGCGSGKKFKKCCGK